MTTIETVSGQFYLNPFQQVRVGSFQQVQVDTNDIEIRHLELLKGQGTLFTLSK